jgi:hypothetical protein
MQGPALHDRDVAEGDLLVPNPHFDVWLDFPELLGLETTLKA